jgi:DNA-binding cell septation regulator SpoVG
MENTIVVKRINPVSGYKNLLAFADVTINGITINGVRLVEGNNGNFLSMPQRQGKQGKYFPICNIEDQSIKDDLLTLLQDELASQQQ